MTVLSLCSHLAVTFALYTGSITSRSIPVIRKQRQLKKEEPRGTI